MSELNNLIKKLNGTHEAEILLQMDTIYNQIGKSQSAWYKKSNFICPDGCGSCCHNFEPDLLKSEAIYMAAWLIANQPENAEKIIQEIYPFDNGKTCPFYNSQSSYHCSIYEGRPLICRLFGGSGAKDKKGFAVWKPCKFYPVEKLNEHKPPLSHRQYSGLETGLIFGTLPPLMSNFSEQVVSINTDEITTALIREILPETIKKLLWLIQMNTCS